MLEGFARLVLEDESLAVYEYSGFSDYRFMENGEIVYKYDFTKINSYDGIFTIRKEGLEQPEIHEKMKRKANGRKVLVQKRVPHSVWPFEKLEKKLAVIDKECTNAFHGEDNEFLYDQIALRLLSLIYKEYQELGHLPESTSFINLEGW